MTRTVPLREKQAWFALADAERCRLLRCSVTALATQHVDERERLENTLPEQEHVRPVTGGGATHYVEENERRFAREIVEWLQNKAGEHEISRLTIFAPPRMLGALRKPPSGSLKGHLEELQGDLMRLEAGQLAEHPMIRDLVRAADEL
jgi:protein required for attachment to host cells